jgi:hypothetical protein
MNPYPHDRHTIELAERQFTVNVVAPTRPKPQC